MCDYDTFLRADEAHARFAEKRYRRSRFVHLDYEDGGSLKCGICKGKCFQHFNDGSHNDIGECCVKEQVV